MCGEWWAVFFIFLEYVDQLHGCLGGSYIIVMSLTLLVTSRLTFEFLIVDVVVTHSERSLEVPVL